MQHENGVAEEDCEEYHLQNDEEVDIFVDPKKSKL